MAKSATGQSSTYFAKLETSLADAGDNKALYDAIVNAPFQDLREAAFLGLGIIVFMLVNKSTGTIDRIALSKTEFAEGAVKVSAKPFKEIKIPADHPENIIAKAIREDQPQKSEDWQYFFIPALSPKDAHFNQASAGIGYSIVYPLSGHVKGAITYSYFLYPEEIKDKHREFMKHYTNLVSGALEKHAKSD